MRRGADLPKIESNRVLPCGGGQTPVRGRRVASNEDNSARRNRCVGVDLDRLRWQRGGKDKEAVKTRATAGCPNEIAPTVTMALPTDSRRYPASSSTDTTRRARRWSGSPPSGEDPRTWWGTRLRPRRAQAQQLRDRGHRPGGRRGGGGGVQGSARGHGQRASAVRRQARRALQAHVLASPRSGAKLGHPAYSEVPSRREVR